MRKTFLIALFLAFTSAFGGGLAVAQSGQFAPRLMVDNMPITNYEYDQRLRFMTLLNAPGDLRKEAERTLVDDRLRQIAAKREGVRLTDAQVLAGMEEFSGRFQMPLEQFLSILQANGVASETFRDFVRSGLLWREVVRARFGPIAPSLVSDNDINRALSTLVQKAATRVLMSEITLRTDQRKLAEEISASATSEARFAGLAREHSAAPSAKDGGRLDWVATTSLPPAVAAALETAGPGKVTAPVQIPTGWAVYFLRRIEDAKAITPALTAIDYAVLRLPADGGVQLADIRARTDRCNDLNRYAKGQPEGTLRRQTVLQSTLPRDIAAAIDSLDDNEITTLVQGGAQTVVMLCSRRVASDKPASTDALRARLTDERFGVKADIYLQDLRANAHIRKP